jgi:hypothetical protein
VIAERAAGEKERREQQEVRIDDPLRAPRVHRERLLHHRQRHVDHGAVDERHRGTENRGGEDQALHDLECGGLPPPSNVIPHELESLASPSIPRDPRTRMVDDQIYRVLMRFHREVVVKDIERIVDERLDERLEVVREEMLGHIDAIYKRFDRLETEYHALSAAVARLEIGHHTLTESVARLENRLPN